MFTSIDFGGAESWIGWKQEKKIWVNPRRPLRDGRLGFTQIFSKRERREGREGTRGRDKTSKKERDQERTRKTKNEARQDKIRALVGTPNLHEKKSPHEFKGKRH